MSWFLTGVPVLNRNDCYSVINLWSCFCSHAILFHLQCSKTATSNIFGVFSCLTVIWCRLISHFLCLFFVDDVFASSVVCVAVWSPVVWRTEIIICRKFNVFVSCLDQLHRGLSSRRRKRSKVGGTCGFNRTARMPVVRRTTWAYLALRSMAQSPECVMT